MSQSPELCQLDYGLAPSHRRRWIRRAATTFVLGVISFSSWHWGPMAWRQARIVYWQRQCMGHVAPPTTIVYDESPSAATALFKGDLNYIQLPLPIGDLPIGDSAGHINSTVTASEFRPPEWTALLNAVGIAEPFDTSQIPVHRTGAIVFLHKVESPSHHRRLVCVNFCTYYWGETLYTFQAVVISPATLTTSLESVISGSDSPLLDDGKGSYLPINRPTRIFAGQIDPNDPTHFAIYYKVGSGIRGLEGRLNDLDRVTLTRTELP